MTRVREALRAIRGGVAEHKRGLAGAAVLLMVLGVAVASIRPWSTTTYDLQDSGVWVTRTDEGGQIGRLNAQIASIDYARDTPSPGLVQDGRDVYLVATEGSSTTVVQLDATDAEADPIETVDLGAEAEVGAGGGVVAALVEGDLTVVGRNGRLGRSGPSIELGDDARLAVSPGGAVAGYSPSEGRIELLRAGQATPTTFEVPELEVADPSTLTLTLVGERPVVLDASRSEPRVLVPGRDPVALGEDAQVAAIQRPGPAAGQVVVATAGALLGVDLDRGDTEVIDDTYEGDPIRPAVDEDCTYGAWLPARRIAVVVHCADRGPVRRDDAASSAQWRFRTGGPSTVLNDTTAGGAYVMVDGTLAQAGPWPDERDSETTRTEFDLEPPDPRDNKAPVAVADTGGPGTGKDEQGVGARVGRVTYLPVLRNDHDPNGDILAVDPELKGFSAGDEDLIDVVPDGRSVAIDLTGADVEEGATIHFEYRATDGEEVSEYVGVDVEVISADAEGQPPQAIPLPPLAHDVEAGQRASFEVLSAFWDFDGDPVFLESVESTKPQHRVSWSADGRISFTADQPDVVELSLVVKDITGLAVPAPPSLTVTVENPDQGTPVLRNDVVASVVDREVSIDPLANDLSPTGRPLRLVESEVLRPAGSSGLGRVEVVDGRRLRFTPEVAGDHVLLYRVEADGQTEALEATVLVRVAQEVGPPLVRPDVVVVEETKANEIDLLANDLDPGGGLVSVTDLRPSRLAGTDRATLDGLAELMSVSVQDDYRTLRVDLRSGSEAGTYATFDYVAVNADGSASSSVTVVVAPFRENRPPDTRDTRVSVRAGDVATVPLAAFASDPDRDPLEVAVAAPPEVGDARPSGDSIRFFAPAGAGEQEVTVDVVVTEPAGNPQAAQLTMAIVGPDAENPPVAPDLEARVREGGSVTVAVPVDRIDRSTGAVGLDPDGDAVRVVGRSGTERVEGKVTVDHGLQAFVFESDAGSGRHLEAFTYQVVDSTGSMSSDGTVRILVSEVGENHPPVAMVDRATAIPGREIYVDAVANDTDLDGDPLKLSTRIGREGVDEAVVVETPEQCEADATAAGLVRITTKAGADPEQRCTVAYAVVDTVVGADEDDATSVPQEGEIVVAIRPGFTGVRPLARDDHVIRADFPGPGPIVVDVKANDEDRDGDPAALQVTLVDAGGEVTDGLTDVSLDPRSGDLTVDLADDPQVVRYRITDDEDLSADAVVRVPARDENAPPVLVQDTPVEVTAGEREIVDLRALVQDPDGPDEEITFAGATAPDGLDAGPIASGLGRGQLVLQAEPTATGTVRVPIRARDVEGAVAVLEVEVTIEGAPNTPPEFGGNPCGEIEAGVTDRRIPLSASDRDTADNDSLRFGIKGAGSREQVTARIQGRSLVVAAAVGAPVGRTARFTLTVADPEGAEDELACDLRIVRSEQPPLRVTEGGATVEQGEARTIDVTQYVANATTGLRVDGPVTVVPTGAGSVRASGTTLTFTAARDAPSGEAVVAYSVTHDRTVRGTTNERASGRIVIQIVGRPDAPSGVSARALETPGSVEVRWNPGRENGSAVTEFRVRGAGSGARRCRSTPCTLTGLGADGARYAFSVTATNAVGTSEPSAPSDPVTLDQPPAPPVITRAVAAGPAEGSGRRVSFDWRPGGAKGSDVVGYGPVVTGAGSVSMRGDTGLDAVVVGGGRVCLAVTATNGSGEASPPSAPRCVDDAYGRPEVRITSVTPTDDGTQTAVVAWTETASGRPITQRRVTGEACTSSNVRPGSATVTCSGRGARTLTVAVTTEGGTASDAASGTFFERPSIQEVTISGGYRSATVRARVDDGGAAIDGGRFELDNGVTGTLSRDGSGTVGVRPWEAVSVVSAVVCRGASCSAPVGSGPTSPPPFGDAPTPDLTVEPRADGGDPARPAGSVTARFDCTVGGPGRTHRYQFLVDGVAVGTPETLTGCAGGATFRQEQLSPDGGSIEVRITDSASSDPLPGVASGPYDEATVVPPTCDSDVDLGCQPCPAPPLPPIVPCDPDPGGGAPAPRGAVVGPILDQPRRNAAPR